MDEFERLRDQWLDLRHRCGVSTPQADPDRFAAMVSALAGAAPYVVSFDDGARSLGLLVGRIERKPVKCRFGYCRVPTLPLRSLEIAPGGLLVAPGSAAGRGALLDHLRTILGDGTVEHVFVNMLQTDHPVFEELIHFRGASVQRTRLHWRGRLLEAASAEPIRLMSSKTRNTQRRKDRKLCRAFGNEVSVDMARAPGDVVRFIDVASAINAKSYHESIGVGVQDTRLWRGILSSEADHGRLRSYVLRAGSEHIAYVAGFVHSNVFHLEATAFLPQYRDLSPGAVLLWRIVDDLISSGVEAIDFGFGDAEYKRIYGNESWEESAITIFGPGFRAGAARFLDVTTAGFTRTAERLLKSNGIFRSLKNGWRRRMERRQAGAQESNL